MELIKYIRILNINSSVIKCVAIEIFMILSYKKWIKFKTYIAWKYICFEFYSFLAKSNGNNFHFAINKNGELLLFCTSTTICSVIFLLKRKLSNRSMSKWSESWTVTNVEKMELLPTWTIILKQCTTNQCIRRIRSPIKF